MLMTKRGGASLLRVLALLVALSLVAAACGNDDDATAPTTTAPTTTAPGGTAPDNGDGDDMGMPEDFDPEAIVRIGQTLPMENEVHFDPSKSPFNGDLTRMFLVFGFLLRENAQGGYDPMMAESYEVVDSQTFKLTLLEGVTFTDGAAYDAEAVRTSLMRTRFEVTDERVLAGQHAGFKFLEDVVVDGPLEVTIKLSQPAAGEFIQALADRESVVVSPKQLAENPDEIDTNPVGAGPYTLLESNPQTGEKFRKNPDYHSPNDFPIAGFDFVFSPVGPAGVQALQAGDIDHVGVTTADVAAIETNPRFEIASRITDFGFMSLNGCRGLPPFDNLMVRQAMQLALDRDQIDQLVYGGRATPAFGLWPEEHPRYNPAVEQHNREDADEARQLLADSGVTDLSVRLVYVPSQEWAALATVVQSQLNAVGFDIELFAPPNIIADFIGTGSSGVMMVPGSRTNVDKYGRVFSEGAQQALCGESSQEVMDLVAPTAGMDPSDPESINRYQEAELLIAENAWLIPIVYRPTLTAYNVEVFGGTPLFTSQRGLEIWDGSGLYPKK